MASFKGILLTHFLSIFAQEDVDRAHAAGLAIGAMGCFFLVIYLAVIVFVIAGWWKMFVKAGQPGWAAIVPFYNVYILCKIGGKPGWWFILFFIPFVNVIVSILLIIAIAQNFGKGAGFMLGLFFLPFIFYPLLGFGDAHYQPTGQQGFMVNQ